MIMTVKLELEPEIEALVAKRATARGLTVEAYIQTLLEGLVAEPATDSREQLNPLDESLTTGSGTNDASRPASRIVGKTSPAKDRSREQAWLAAHRDQYAGQWVALDGDRLLAHGPNLKRVAEAAHRSGADDALIARAEAVGAPPYVGM